MVVVVVYWVCLAFVFIYLINVNVINSITSWFVDLNFKDEFWISVKRMFENFVIRCLVLILGSG